MILDPDYPHTVFSFPYRGVTVQITLSQEDDIRVYSAWVNYPTGSAVAVPKAYSRQEAIRRARGWVDEAFTPSP